VLAPAQAETELGRESRRRVPPPGQPKHITPTKPSSQPMKSPSWWRRESAAGGGKPSEVEGVGVECRRRAADAWQVNAGDWQ